MVTRELDEEPGSAAGERWDGSVTASTPEDVDQPRVQAFARDGAVRDDRGRRFTGGDDVVESEHRHDTYGSVRHQLHGRLGDDAQGPLGADEGPGQVEAFGQEVMRGVPGDLSSEPVELRAHGGQVPRHHPT